MPAPLAPESPSPSDAFARLRRAKTTGLATLDLDELAIAAASDPDAFHLALRALTRSLTPGVGTAASDASTAIAFLDGLAARLETPATHVEYLSATADLFQALAAVDVTAAVRSRKSEPLLAAVDRRAQEHPDRFATAGGTIARSLVLGKIHSLSDRDKAAAQFQNARDADTEQVIRNFYVDTGAMTYHAADEIDVATTAKQTTAIQSSIHPYDEAPAGSRTSIVLSVDEKFYRVYAPLVLYYAQQLPDLDFTILICGSSGTADALVADGHLFQRALTVLNHSGAPTNVHHYVVPVPRFVAEARTFYACARFFALAPMLERYPNLYVMDADLTIDVHPQAFLRKMKEIPFAAPRHGGEAALSPWRRFMAGNIAANRKVLQTPLLDDVLAYLVHGLARKSSWMLDQNALAYAVERSPNAFTNLNDYSRPFRAPSFKATWEKNYRR